MSNDQTKAAPTDEQAEKCSLRLCCRSDEHAEGCTTYDPARYPDKSEPAAQQAAPNDDWISVKDRLPEPWDGKLFSKSVLIVDMDSRYPHVRMSELNFEEHEGKIVPTVWSGADPTHWKPEPALPSAAPATAGMVGQDAKDAARYRWLKSRFTGYDFHWMGTPPYEAEEDQGKCVIVFECGQHFNAGRDFESGIDAAMAAQQAQASAKDENLDPNQVQTVADRIRNTHGLAVAKEGGAMGDDLKGEDNAGT